MNCPKCKAKLPDNVKYCPRCGYLFENDEVAKSDTLDQQLLSIYTDKKLLYQPNFSLGFLLFNFVYAFYRRMYTEGIYSCLSTTLLIVMLKRGLGIIFQSMGFYALAVFFIVLGCIAITIYYVFQFDNLYIIHAKSRINKILKEHPDSDFEVLSRLCIKDSKGNIVFAIISSIIFIIFLITQL